MRRRQTKLAWLLFFLISLGIFVSFLGPKRIWQQKAQQTSCEININAKQITPLNRNWGYYSQGGEEKSPMLAPVADLISEIKPVMIRIDHTLDYPDIEQRVNEIYQLGAKPFISLSYFPTEISSNPTVFPASLDGWTNLIAKTAETISRLSGNDELYYEVWNEPDLFGGMDADKYFLLYQSTLSGLNRCGQCRFKIGGPAITTLKNDWMNRFLGLIADSNTKLDFISWHSYQRKPSKTVEEVERLRGLSNFKRLAQPVELMVTEWGIVPEVSPLNDGYASASHTIAGIAATNGLLEKIFAFEIKDGPDPEGKQLWGRWGMITHQNNQPVTKPRFEAFRMLNNLMEYRLAAGNQDNVYSLATTNGLTDYSVIVTQIANPCQAITTAVNSIPNGTYQQEIFSLDPIHNPTIALSQKVPVGNNRLTVDIPSIENGVYQIQLHRINSALINGPGRTGGENDRSARIGQGNIGLEYPLGIDRFKAWVGFWYKSMAVEGLTGNYRLAEIFDSENRTSFAVEFVFNQNNKPALTAKKIPPSGVEESVEIDLSRIDLTQWHYYRFLFDNQTNTFGLLFDNSSSFSTYMYPWPVESAGGVAIGPLKAGANYAEGMADSVEIRANEDKLIYTDEFNL